MKFHSLAALSVLALAAGGAAAQATQGVSKTEIVLGSIQDLSGPLAAYGKELQKGMQLRAAEINEQGGIHGRKIRMLFEDSGYDPKRANLGAQKLVNQEKIFAMIGHIGTAQNMAAMPVQFEKNVVNFLPLTAAREMYEPHHKLKFAFASTYYDQMRLAVPKLAKDKGAKKPCILYQDDDYGLEVLRGAEAGLKANGMDFAEKTTYKRGATDFSSQVARMKAAGCDIVVLGTIIRETIGTMAESKKTGFAPTAFIGPSAVYTDVLHKIGARVVDGLYATHTSAVPYLDDGSQAVRFWAQKYKTKFNEDPGVFSTYGYTVADIFIAAANKAGPNLTTDSFVKAMESLKMPPDIFGGPEQSWSAKKRLGNDLSRLSVIEGGKWKAITPYFK